MEEWIEELPVDGAHARHGAAGTDAVRQQSTSYFPREHGRVVLLVLGDLIHHVVRRHLRLRAADDARLDRASLVEPVTVARQYENNRQNRRFIC